MNTELLFTTALLGTNRMKNMPASPDPALEKFWQGLPDGDPAAAVLGGLAVVRVLRAAGAKSQAVTDLPEECDRDTVGLVPAAATEALSILLESGRVHLLPEWVELAFATGGVVPGRMLESLLDAATKSPPLRPLVRALAGKKGPWIANLSDLFSWLNPDTPPGEDDWDDGEPEERLAWLRLARLRDSVSAMAAVEAQWAGEEPEMREAIVRIIRENPRESDEAWLETYPLCDRRQGVREQAAISLTKLPGSAFYQRAISRMRSLIKITGEPGSRVFSVEPPEAWDPEWAKDGLKQKPPQGGEKAWWLEQIIVATPLDAWPGLLDIDAAEVFFAATRDDWWETLCLGWVDSARRMPECSIPEHFLPFLANPQRGPRTGMGNYLLMSSLAETLDEERKFRLLDRICLRLYEQCALELLTRITGSPPAGTGAELLAKVHSIITAKPPTANRHHARILAMRVPASEIQGQLDLLSQRPELSAPAEEFAILLEFRRSLRDSFKTS